jgi:uncharacterized membrane protein
MVTVRDLVSVRRLGPQLPAIAVAAVTTGFILLYSHLVLRRFDAFNYYAFDLGIFDQGIWLLSRFQEPFITLRGLNLFGDHSSYITVLLVPLYWIWSDVRILLVFTVGVIGAGIPLVYLIARTHGLSKWVGAGLATAFALHPAVAWLTWDNFHPELVAFPLLLSAYLAALHRRQWAVLVSLGLVLLCKEDAALVVIPFGFYLWWKMKQRTTGLIAAGIGFGVALLNFQVLLPHFSPTGELLYADRYAQWGDGFFGILWGVVSQPFKVVDEFFEANRIRYLTQMLLPLPSVLLAPVVLLIAVPITAANLFTTFFYQYDIKYHYSVYLAAIVGIATVAGIARLSRLREHLVPAGTIVVLAAALIGNAMASPSPIGLSDQGYWPEGAAERTAIQEALEVIPADAAVSAEATIATHLSQRRAIYEFPSPFIRWKWGTLDGPDPDPNPDDVDWIVARNSFLGDWRHVFDPIVASPGWETVVESDAVIVLRRR